MRSLFKIAIIVALTVIGWIVITNLFSPTFGLTDTTPEDPNHLYAKTSKPSPQERSDGLDAMRVWKSTTDKEAQVKLCGCICKRESS